MQTMEIIKEIQEKGLRESYFRFVMIVPRKFLGKGRSFDEIAGKGDEFDKTTSWYRDDCRIPMSYVDAIEWIHFAKGKVTLSMLVDKEDLGRFATEMVYHLNILDCDLIIEEYKNGV